MSRIYRGCQNVLESRNNAQKTNTAAIRYITCTDNWLARSNKNIIQFNCHKYNSVVQATETGSGELGTRLPYIQVLRLRANARDGCVQAMV